MIKKTVFFAVIFLRCFSYASKYDAELHFARGLLLEYEGQYAKALDEYKTAIDLDKQAYTIYSYAVKAAIQSDNDKLAEELLNKLTEAEPKNADNWVLLGTLNWAKSEKEKALKYYQKALELDPENLQALYQAANMLKTENPEKAKFYFKEYIKKSKTAKAYGYYELGVIDYGAGKIASAFEYFKKSKEENRLFLEPRYSIAHIYETQKKYADAISEYNELEKIDSLNDRLYARTAQIYLLLNDNESASVYFLKAKKINNSNIEANVYLAQEAERKGDFEKALKCSKDSALYLKDYTLWIRAAYYLNKLDKNKEAVLELERALQKWPENVEIPYFIALGYDTLGNTKKAFEVLKAVLEKTPKSKKLQFQYAIFAEKLNYSEEAEKTLKELIEQNPQDALAHNYLGYMLADRSLKLDEAEQYIRKALELSPENGGFLDSLAWVYYKRGNIDKAKEIIDKSLEKEKRDKIIWRHCGIIYMELGNMEKAWKCFKTALFLDSKDTKNRDLIKKIERKLSGNQIYRLYTDYLKDFAGRYEKFAAICKINMKTYGSNHLLNTILKFDSKGSVDIDILDPFYAPAVNIGLNVNGKYKALKMPSGFTEPKYEKRLNNIIREIIVFLWDYFSADIFDYENPKISKKSKKMKNNKYKLYSNSQEEYLTKVKSENLTIRLSDYKKIQNRFIPSSISVKAKGIKADIIFDKIKTQFKN